MPSLDEFEIIARYFKPLAAKCEGALGLSDDAAALRVGAGRDLIVTADALVEGVHFLPSDPPGLIARKMLRVNLSDLAAKGATPTVYLMTLALGPAVDESWIASFASGLAQDQDEFGVALAGGDTTATPGPTTLSVTAMGEVAQGQALRRNGARAGDGVWVSGNIGDGALGLAAARGESLGVDADAAASLADRYRLPRPRVTLGPRLVGVAHAAMDVSDGLVGDLRHICDASGLGAEIEAARVPLSAAARTVLARAPERLREILTGGDDYEILFTAPASRDGALAVLSTETGIALTRIGTIAAGSGVTVCDAAGGSMDMGQGGYRHFGAPTAR
ncbi:MAG: thiamine-phosphate kinase [Alphaproteobacteria bacterium]|nr:thiamine-phosphate kinase [Alphaproteobacteria bacterium]